MNKTRQAVKTVNFRLYFKVIIRQNETQYFIHTGCLKKKVIELWSALARPLYNLQKSFFRSRKD